MQKLLIAVDSLSTWFGKACAWSVVALTGLISWEVFSRYVLNDPHAWVLDAQIMLYGLLCMTAGAYTLAKNGHVRGDVLYGFFKPRTQASIDLTLYIIFFLPAVAAFIYSGWAYAKMSVQFREVSIFSPAGIPVFPLKALIPITGVFLLLQGIAEIIRCIICIRDGEWPQKLHDVEETESVILQEQRIHAADNEPGQRGA